MSLLPRVSIESLWWELNEAYHYKCPMHGSSLINSLLVNLDIIWE